MYGRSKENGDRQIKIHAMYSTPQFKVKKIVWTTNP